MPVRTDSRYNGAPVYDAVDANGVTHPTIGIRLQPDAAPAPALYNHTLTAAESIEILAARYYNSSAAWWRIADQNPLKFPLDIRPGESVALVPPGVVSGQIQRTRSF